jgi:hypothetical protein
MAKFHFNVWVGGELERDADGVELSCVGAARTAVVECLREFFERQHTCLPVKNCRFEIVDEVGAIVMTVPFIAGLDS